MIKLKELLTEPIPEFLYHATFNALVPGIESKGLIPNGQDFKNFEDVESGVYLSNDYGFAGSMVENTENPNIPEKWFNEIVVLVISTKNLDPKKFDEDPNVNLPEEPNGVKSYIYKGIIPPSEIKEIVDFT